MSIIISNIFGYLAVLFNLLLFLSANRQTICVIKAVIEIFWAISYFIIAKYTVALLTATAFIRQCIFFWRGKKAWADGKWWLFIFLAFALISPTAELISVGLNNLTFNIVALNLLTVTGSIFYIFAYYSKSALKTKLLALPGVILYFTYMMLIGNIPGIIGNTLSLISISVGLIREFIKIKNSLLKKDGEKGL